MPNNKNKNILIHKNNIIFPNDTSVYLHGLTDCSWNNKNAIIKSFDHGTRRYSVNVNGKIINIKQNNIYI